MDEIRKQREGGVSTSTPFELAMNPIECGDGAGAKNSRNNKILNTHTSKITTKEGFHNNNDIREFEGMLNKGL